MKKLTWVLLCLLLAVALSFSVLAEEPQAPIIVDNADVLTSDEEAELTSKAYSVTWEYDMNVVIVVVQDLNGEAVEYYTDDYYSRNYESRYDSGVIFLLAMDTREWAINTYGDAIYALTDYGIEELFYTIADDLSDDDYYSAFDTYLSELPDYFDAYLNGSPIDGYPDFDYDGPGYIAPADRDEVVYYPDYDEEPGVGTYFRILLVSLLIGAAAGGVAILIMRGQMNTAKAQKGATSYLVGGSFDLKRRQDIFLYSNVTKTRRAENNSSGGHRGGGSSVHRSSGGRSFGGRSGRF